MLQKRGHLKEPSVNIKINGSDDNSIYIDGGGTVSAVNFNARPVGASAHTISLNGETGSATFAGRILDAPEFYSGSVDNFYLTSNYQQGGIGSADGAGIFRLRDPDSTHGLQQAIRITQGGNQPSMTQQFLCYTMAVPHSQATSPLTELSSPVLQVTSTSVTVLSRHKRHSKS